MYTTRGKSLWVASS